jgi:hypothetical protein
MANGTFLTRATSRLASLFSSASGTYDATEDRGRRRPPLRKTASEDAIATERKREIMSATGQDLARNFVLLKYMIRRHLDYVSTFTFQALTPDRAYNAYVERWWQTQAARTNFDVARRHPHRRAVRIAEALAVIDGDVHWLKLAPERGHPWRGKRQMIEGSRIALAKGDIPPGDNAEDWINGLKIDPVTGAATHAAISRRTQSKLSLDRIVPITSLTTRACYEFRFDQVRGTSAIAAGLNWLKDTYEAFDYANAKLKLGQLFGVQIYSNTNEMQWERDEEGYDVDFGRGPFVMELDQGDKAEVLQSRTQSADDTNYLGLLMLICMKALDLPYSMLDASKGKFHGNKTELIQYQKSCEDRIRDLQEFQNEDADWRIDVALADGELELPRGQGREFLQYKFEPGGVPPWDSAKEYRGSAMGVASGFTNPYDECTAYNTDFERNIDRTAQALEYAKSKGVTLQFADASAFAPEIVVAPGANAAPTADAQGSPE